MEHLEADTRQAANRRATYNKIAAIISPGVAAALTIMAAVKPDDANTIFWTSFITLAVLGIAVGIYTVICVTDITKYFFEYDDTKKELKNEKDKCQKLEKRNKTLIESLNVIKTSLNSLVDVIAEVQDLRSQGEQPTKEQVNNWLNRTFQVFESNRFCVFGYQTGIYNHAIYIADENYTKLRVLKRWTDERYDIKNTEQTPGAGIIGQGYTLAPQNRGVTYERDTWRDEKTTDLTFHSKLLAHIHTRRLDKDKNARGILVISEEEPDKLEKTEYSHNAGIFAAITSTLLRIIAQDDQKLLYSMTEEPTTPASTANVDHHGQSSSHTQT